MVSVYCYYGVTNYFPPEIKGNDPNMRPLRACNKMIIEFDDRPPSPPSQLHSPIHANSQFLVMDYSGITYIYHFLRDRLCVECSRRKDNTQDYLISLRFIVLFPL